ncbi:MAG: iron-containing alcohol dehydrogenase, partial [Smithellaceae bacterium]|nr:iron-containing alcohol dehydrogenase [Smithellaceae bacterium]
GAKKIVFGRGAFETLGDQVKEWKGSRPLVVLDRNLAALGWREKVGRVLENAGLAFSTFDQVDAEPPLESADEGAALAIKEGCDLVVGIGGGSALDVAKAVAVLAANRGRAVDYLGLNNVPGPGLPKIMIPTTAGTGSEVTFTSVFLRRELNKKEGMNSPFLYPELALLDPLLTLSLPPGLTATTGLDALCHAIESYTSMNASPMSELFSLEAIELIGANLRTAVHDGTNIEAREKMLLGSLYAGLGLANAGVTAVHSLSYPLGGRYGIPHGLANTILLPAVMNYNVPGAIDKFALITAVLGERTGNIGIRDAAFLAVEAVQTLIADCGIDDTLESLNIPPEDFPELARIAMTVARPLANNPRRITEEDAISIYQDAY